MLADLKGNVIISFFTSDLEVFQMHPTIRFIRVSATCFEGILVCVFVFGIPGQKYNRCQNILKVISCENKKKKNTKHPHATQGTCMT